MPTLGLPTWLVVGLVLAGVLALLVAAIFVVGDRLSPTETGGHEHPDQGEQLRREEIRYYLEAIGEPFREDATVEGREVAFYLEERDVAVTFDPRAYLALEESPVHPILVEHEMPGVHLRNRLPFETPTVGAEDGAASGVSTAGAGGETDQYRAGRPRDDDPVETSFALLGLPPSASLEQVERAYRNRIKEVHPDHGGDEESFRQVRDAYDTAKEHAD